jgi:hypothetical protein
MPDLSAELRLAALDRVVERFDVDTEKNTAAGEKLAEIREAPSGLLRWVTVTTTGGDDAHTAVEDWPTLDEATQFAVANVRDSIYVEFPVAIVDLDTGAVRRPDWSALPWVPAKPLA